MAKKKDIAIGDIVTCYRKVEAYQSRECNGRIPECWFEPGDFGIVAAVDVPAVRGRECTFCCIDFFKPGIMTQDPIHDPKGRRPWRVALFYDNIRKLA